MSLVQRCYDAFSIALYLANLGSDVWIAVYFADLPHASAVWWGLIVAFFSLTLLMQGAFFLGMVNDSWQWAKDATSAITAMKHRYQKVLCKSAAVLLWLLYLMPVVNVIGTYVRPDAVSNVDKWDWLESVEKRDQSVKQRQRKFKSMDDDVNSAASSPSLEKEERTPQWKLGQIDAGSEGDPRYEGLPKGFKLPEDGAALTANSAFAKSPKPPVAATTTVSFVDDHLTSAVVEEIKDMARMLRFIRATITTIARVKRAHAMLILHAFLHDIPMVCVQLIAISLQVGGPQPATIQFVCLGLSLGSLLSRLLLVLNAIDFWSLIAKMLFVVFDAASFTYMMTFLFSSTQPAEKHLVGREVSTLSYGWLWSFAGVVGCWALVGIVLGIVWLCRHGCKRDAPIVVLCIIIFCGPCAVIMVAAKASWSLPLIYHFEPPREDTLNGALMFGWMSRGGGTMANSSLWSKKLQYFAKKASTIENSKKYSTSYSHSECDKRRRLLREAVEKQPFSPWALYTDVQLEGKSIVNWPKGFMECMWAFLLIIYTLMQIYTGLFPLLAFCMYRTSQTVLQTVLFWVMIGSGSAILLLLPVLWPVFKFLVTTQFCWRWHFDMTPNGKVMEFIKEWYIPPHIVACRNAIPLELYPAEVAEYIVGFLDPADVDLRGLSIDQCEQLKTEAVAEENHHGDVAIADETTPLI